MSFGPPTLAGFQAFIVNNMGISNAVLPPTAPVIQTALTVAIDVVNLTLNAIPDVYTLAVYNRAGDNLINYAPDAAPSTYFADLRANYKISGFTAGVVSSTSDEGTSVSIDNPDFMKGLTMSDLQNLKTPYGRQYLAFAQRYGTLWGLT